MDEAKQDIFCYRDDEGDTILHIAVAKHLGLQVASILQNEQHKEILNAQNNEGQTALHLAVITDQQEIVNLLINAGADQSIKLNDGDTVQHLATRLGKNQCLGTLCQSLNEQTLKIQNEAGDTALHTAVLADNYMAFGIILGRIQDVNCKNSKTDETPLHYAVKKDKLKMTQDLLQRDADINAITVDGNTPLHFITSKDQRDLAEALLQKGADIYVKNKAGRSPHDMADKTLARFLQRNRSDRKTRKPRRPKELKMDVTEEQGTSRNRSVALEENPQSNKISGNSSVFPGKKPKLCADDDGDVDDDGDSMSQNSNVFQPDFFNRIFDETSSALSTFNETGNVEVPEKLQLPSDVSGITLNPLFPANSSSTSAIAFDQNSLQTVGIQQGPGLTNQTGFAGASVPSGNQDTSGHSLAFINLGAQQQPNLQQQLVALLLQHATQNVQVPAPQIQNNANLESSVPGTLPNYGNTQITDAQGTLDLNLVQNILSQNYGQNNSLEDIAKFLENQQNQQN